MPSSPPPCFTVLQWRSWREGFPNEKSALRDYCKDCTPAYQREQSLIGRCNYPDVTFTDGQGHRSGEPKR